ncbi:hypothetical protein [Nocardia grenadensis]|uniref:hypothetical protein n=1 Tax=Nocardia grenadensis TaxID=931537 RepID=UPI0007A46E63|nr:hypothetical protein [Nocardia grenadensis]
MPHWWIDANPPDREPTQTIDGSTDICLTCARGTGTSEWRAATDRNHPVHYRPLSLLDSPLTIGGPGRYVEAEIQTRHDQLPRLTITDRNGYVYTGFAQRIEKAEPAEPPNIYTINAGWHQRSGPWLLDWAEMPWPFDADRGPRTTERHVFFPALDVPIP